ncbi:hypothetical protein J1614_005264 [Plenodomus biglobosus]|nr:hypothetical protein J1614_005264 [Plenodomus biglobosus]
MSIDWKDKDVADRLLAAVLASYDNKINCREVARLFGRNATYNTIENQLRKPKKLAADLKKEARDKETTAFGAAKEVVVSKSKSKIKSPGKGVKTGRVSKTTCVSPRKQNIKIQEKEEEEDEDEDSEEYV